MNTKLICTVLYLLLLTESYYGDIFIPRCHDYQFFCGETCSNLINEFGICIKKERVCDGRTDCKYTSNDEDEELCKKWNCSQHNMWKCEKANKCISPRKRCDGRHERQCLDKEDELDCRKWNCTEGFIKCDDGLRCVSKSAICDCWADCQDGSDERNCTPDNRRARCSNGKCIYHSKVCDGKKHCSDGGDELNCNKRICPWPQFHCGYGKCLSNDKVCDKKSDCSDGSDETECNRTKCWSVNRALCPEKGTCIASRCGNQPDCPSAKCYCYRGEYKCNNSRRCIPNIGVCSSISSCPLGDDESESTCGPWQCTEDYFKCQKDMRCIHKHRVCNGRKDCQNGEDEQNCKKWKCWSSKEQIFGNVYQMIKTSTNKCIDQYGICNGIRGFFDYSDEKDCWKFDLSYKVLCNDKKLYVCKSCSAQKSTYHKGKRNALHDSVKDCYDGSDELMCQAGIYRCHGKFWKCDNNRNCIYKHDVCDNELHCPDGSDEDKELCKVWLCSQKSCTSERKCVRMLDVCDGKSDCIGGEDEKGCLRDIGEDDLQCYHSNTRISKLKVCDGENDCEDTSVSKDLSDETNCAAWTCVAPMIRCPASDHRCIRATDICDGKVHCPSGSDELCSSSCAKNLPLNIQRKSLLIRCSRGKKTCVPVDLYCDGKSDCPEGTDEMSCTCSDWGLSQCRGLYNTYHCLPHTWISRRHMACYQDKVQGQIKMNTGLSSKRSSFKIKDKAELCSNISQPKDYGLLYCQAAYNVTETHILIDRVVFYRYNIQLKKMMYTFMGCEFEESIITDDDNLSNQTLEINVINCKFTEKSHQNISGIFLHKTPFISLFLKNARFHNSKLSLKSFGIWIIAVDTQFESTSVNIQANSAIKILNVVQFSNVFFCSCESINKLHVLSNNLFLVIKKSYFKNIDLYFHSQDHSNSYIFLVYLVNSVTEFKKWLEPGIKVHLVSKNKLLKSMVMFLNVTLLLTHDQTKPIESLLSSKKNLISIESSQSKFGFQVCYSIFVSTSKNIALTFSFLSTSENVHGLFRSCLFVGSVIGKAIPLLSFKERLKLEQTYFYTTDMEQDTDYHIIVASQSEAVKSFASCPMWYLEELVLANERELISNFSLVCRKCPETMHAINLAPIEIDVNSVMNKTNKCTRCPYGGHCSGFKVTPQPNFWGYIDKYGSRVIFLQPPFGYCCLGTEIAPCDAYNACAGKRTGVLCGVCQPGYTLSILSDNCVPIDTCDSPIWFWFSAILLAMTYALWYIFKNDMFLDFRLIAALYSFLAIFLSRCFGNSSFKWNNRIDAKNGSKDEKTASTVRKIPKYESYQLYYFGIVINYVQMYSIIKLSLDFSDITQKRSLFYNLESFITKLLRFEWLLFSPEICPIQNVSTAIKFILKVFFLLIVYLCWVVMALLTKYAQRKCFLFKKKILIALKETLIIGLIDIICYTNSGFAGIVLMSLTCTSYKGIYVWFYDGSVQCFQPWQILILVFGLFTTLPFPLALYLGIKQLRINEIHYKHFTLACLFPLPACFYLVWRVVYKSSDNQGKSKRSICNNANIILKLIQGPFKSGAQFWECYIIFRRLLISLAILISHNTMRLLFYTLSCSFFAVHQFTVFPFIVKSSNILECFSLFSLIIVAAINLLKAALVDAGITPTGSLVKLYQILEGIEPFFLLSLLLAILLIECHIKFRLLMKRLKAN